MLEVIGLRKNRKNEIYETAMSLFQEKGYETVSVVDICEACGITKKAFYYHYTSKDELLAQHYILESAEFDWDSLKCEESRPDVSYVELLWKRECALIDSTVQLGVNMGQAYSQYNRRYANSNSPFVEGPFRNISNQDEYVAMVARGQTAGQIRGDRPAEELLFILFSAVIGLSSHWRNTGGAYDLKAEVRRIFDFVMLPPPTDRP